MKYALINQPAGLGDIFYLQKAVKLFLHNNYTVIWPVIKHFEYIKNYIKYPNLVFVNKEENFLFKDIYNKNYKQLMEESYGDYSVLTVPFVHAVEMKHKYPMVNINCDDWKDFFKFERNHERELALKQKYNIQDGEEFIFVNNIFASPPDMHTRNIPLNTDKKVIYNDGEPCHIFDFCWLFENASELHLVESVFCYLVEVLQTKGKLFMYSRVINGQQQHQNFNYINHIYKKDWIKIR